MYYLGRREAVPEPFFMKPFDFIRELLEEADEARPYDPAKAERLINRARAQLRGNHG